MEPAFSAWKTVVLLPLFYLLPGTAGVVYIRDRYHANLPRVDVAIIGMALSVAVSSLTGLALAVCGVFSMSSLALVDLLITAVLVAVILLRRKSARRDRSDVSRWWAVGLLAIAVIASVFYVGRFEAILTERDASPYLAEAVNLANRGVVPLENKDMTRFTADEASVFFGSMNLAGTQEYTSGFRIEDFGRGQVNSRYFPIYSVILATGYRLFGLRGALTIVNPFLAVLGVLVLVVLARQLFGAGIALLAGLLLAVNPIFLWFAKYPIPEIYSMLFLFLGVLCFALYYPKGSGYWGIASALAFGTAVAAHFDMYALVAIVFVLLFVVFIRIVVKRESGGYLLWFAGPFLVVSTAVIACNAYYNGPYIASVVDYVPVYITRSLPTLIPGVLALVVLVPYVARLSVERDLFHGLTSLVKKYWRPALAVLVAAFALLAYFALPYTYVWQTHKDPRVAEGSAKMFFRLSWYFTHLGMGLALLGLVLFVVFGLNQRSLPLFLVAGLFSALLIARPWCNPLHMWMYRRFIPAVIPLLIVFIAYGLVTAPRLFKSATARRAAIAASAAALVALLAFTVPYTLKVRRVVQYRGVLDSNEELARRLSGSEVAAVFFGPLARAYYPDTLRYVYGTNSFSLRDSADPAAFDSACRKLRASGNNVYLIGAFEGLPTASINQKAVPVGAQRVSFGVFRDEYLRKPEKVTPFQYTLRYYLLEESPGTHTVSAELAGEEALLGGFHELEEVDGVRYRWTDGFGMFRLPVPETGDDLTLLLTLRAPHRPGQYAPVPVEIRANGVPVASFQVSREWVGLYPITLPRFMLPPGSSFVELSVKSPVYVPAPEGRSKEQRQLGLQIFGIALRSESE